MLFLCVCFFMAFFMTCCQFQRFVENADSSVFALKPFTSSPNSDQKHGNPTFSICFVDNTGIGGMMKTNVHDEQYNKTKDQLDSKMFNSNATVNITRALRSFKTVTKASETIEWNTMPNGNGQNYEATNTSMWAFPLRVAYRDQFQSCYTPASDVHSILMLNRKYDSLTLDAETVVDGFMKNAPDLTALKVYIHMEGQLTRQLDQPVAEFKVHDVYIPYGKHEYGLNANFLISQVVLQTNRENANDQCDPNIEDDDLLMRQKLIEVIGCIPIYWESIMSKSEQLGNPRCTTSSQYKKIYHYIHNRQKTLNCMFPLALR